MDFDYYDTSNITKDHINFAEIKNIVENTCKDKAGDLWDWDQSVCL